MNMTQYRMEIKFGTRVDLQAVKREISVWRHKRALMAKPMPVFKPIGIDRQETTQGTVVILSGFTGMSGQETIEEVKASLRGHLVETIV